MKLRWNLFIQLVASAGQIANLALPFVPAKYQPAVAAGLAAAQTIAGAVAHYSNPDGTSAITPYDPTRGLNVPPLI